MGIGLASWANVAASFAAMYEWTKEDMTNIDVIVTGVNMLGAGIGAY